MSKDFSFKITKHIATLPGEDGKWKKELNMVSWNGNKPKYDIRDWSPDHEKMGKGLTFTADEARIIVAALCEELQDDERDEAAYRRMERFYAEQDARTLVADYLGLAGPENAPDGIDYGYLAERFLDERGGELNEDHARQKIVADYMKEKEEK